MLKGTHLPVTVKEIQAGYLVSFHISKNCKLYVAQNKLPNTKTTIQKVETLAEKIYSIRFFTTQDHYNSQESNSIVSYTRNIHRQDNYIISFQLICRTSRSHKNVFNSQ